MDIQDQAQVAGNPSLGRSSDDCSRQQAVLRKAVLRKAVLRKAMLRKAMLRKAGMPGQDMSKVIMGIKTLELEAHELEAHELEAHELEAVELALRLQPTIASLKDIVARSDAECTVPCPRQRESKDRRRKSRGARPKKQRAVRRRH